MNRLSEATLEQAAALAIVPQYNRAETGCGIVHLGIGAFHRAHQALLTELAMNTSGGDWGITGVSLRSDSVAKQLLPQDCLYSVLSEDAGEQQLRVIGAVRNVLLATVELPQVLERIADPGTKIISLTITEKGYCSIDGHSLDYTNEDLTADLATPHAPRSAIGVLALGLSLRQDRDAGPLTLLSCDNLSENGRVLEAVLRAYAVHVFPGLLGWLDESSRFPSTMVDRIVPAITEEKRASQSEFLGLYDASAIATEPFLQWIIEDNFAAERPDWQSVGVSFVSDIRPYEQIKLRLLNAAHTAIACIGLLGGKTTVDEVMADPVMGAFVRQLMTRDLMPALDVPPEFDLEDYRDQLLSRFSNPHLAHRCQQIAMDSTVKIGQRWLPSLKHSEPCPLLLRALSTWCYLVLCSDIDIDDPQREALMALRRDKHGNGLPLLLALVQISADTMPGFDLLCSTIERNMDTIREQGFLPYLEESWQQVPGSSQKTY